MDSSALVAAIAMPIALTLADAPSFNVTSANIKHPSPWEQLWKEAVRIWPSGL